MPLGSGFLEERDQVRSVLGLLEPGEHLSTRGPSKLSTAVLCRSRSAACTATGGAQRAGGGGGSHHLGARNVRLRVEQVHVQVLVAPCDACRQTPLSKPKTSLTSRWREQPGAGARAEPDAEPGARVREYESRATEGEHGRQGSERSGTSGGGGRGKRQGVPAVPELVFAAV